MASFSDTVGAWINEVPERLDAAWRKSVEGLAEELTRTVGNGGRLPHRTGNLMRSLLASASGPVPVGAPGQRYTGQDIGLVTAGMKMGDQVWVGFQANYAMRMNYGFHGPDSLGRVYNQEGFNFVERAIAMWTQIVQQAALDLELGVYVNQLNRGG